MLLLYIIYEQNCIIVVHVSIPFCDSELFLSLGTTSGIETFQLPIGDDDASEAINVPNGFRFGTISQDTIYVRSTGYQLF